MAWSKYKLDEVIVRRTKLLELRRKGVRYDDQRIEDLGYSSPSAARKDLARALEAHRDDEAAEVGIYRQQENERLDALLEAVWSRATTLSPVLDKEGEVIDHVLDVKALDTVLRLMDRRAKLNGLDMPVKAELSGPNGGALRIGPAGIDELNKLINMAGDPDDEDDTPGEDEELEDGDVDDDGDHT